MSSSLGRNFAARVKRIYSTKQLLKNPEVVDMVPSITNKAENIPTIGEVHHLQLRNSRKVLSIRCFWTKERDS